MKTKFKIITLSTIIIFIVGLFIFVNHFQLLDRFNIRKNKICINVHSRNSNLKFLKIYFVGEDTLPVYINNELLLSDTPDWYGKEYILVQFMEQKFEHGFSEYKFESFHKTKYNLDIDDYSSEKILLKWSVKTKWYGNDGVDTLCLE